MKFKCQSIATTRDWRLLSLFPAFGQTETQESFWRRVGLGFGPSYRHRSLRRGNRAVPVALQVAFLVGFLLLPMRLVGQLPNRADLLEQERTARIPEVTPPQRTVIERGMIFIQEASERFNSVRGDENGLHYSSGHFPAGAGFGFGVGYSHNGKWVDGYLEPDRPNRLDFHVNAAYSTRDYYETTGGIELMNIGGTIFNVGLHG